MAKGQHRKLLLIFITSMGTRRKRRKVYRLPTCQCVIVSGFLHPVADINACFPAINDHEIQCGNKLTPRGAVLLWSLTVAQIVKRNSPSLTKPQISSQYSQKPTGGPYPIQNKSFLHYHVLSFFSLLSPYLCRDFQNLLLHSFPWIKCCTGPHFTSLPRLLPVVSNLSSFIWWL
jgi:hypothetical protein